MSTPLSTQEVQQWNEANARKIADCRARLENPKYLEPFRMLTENRLEAAEREARLLATIAEREREIAQAREDQQHAVEWGRENVTELKQWINALFPYVQPFHNPSCGLFSKVGDDKEYKCDCAEGARFNADVARAALAATSDSPGTRPVRIDPENAETWPPLRPDSVQRSVLVWVGREAHPGHWFHDLAQWDYGDLSWTGRQDWTHWKLLPAWDEVEK